jgi:hypothetical protein
LLQGQRNVILKNERQKPVATRRVERAAIVLTSEMLADIRAEEESIIRVQRAIEQASRRRRPN